MRDRPRLHQVLADARATLAELTLDHLEGLTDEQVASALLLAADALVDPVLLPGGILLEVLSDALLKVAALPLTRAIGRLRRKLEARRDAAGVSAGS